jgi:hypothetical protein
VSNQKYTYSKIKFTKIKYRGANIAKSSFAKIFGGIGTFGNIGHFRRYGKKNKFFRSKMKKV